MCKGPNEFGGPVRCAADARVNLANQNRIHLEAVRALREAERVLSAAEASVVVAERLVEESGGCPEREKAQSLIARAHREVQVAGVDRESALLRVVGERERLLVRAREYDSTDEGLALLEVRRAAWLDLAREARVGGRVEHARCLAVQESLVREQIESTEAAVLAERVRVAERWAPAISVAEARAALGQAVSWCARVSATARQGEVVADERLAEARRGVARARRVLAALERLSAAPRVGRFAPVPGVAVVGEREAAVRQAFSGVGLVYRATVDRGGAPVFVVTLSCGDVGGAVRTQVVTLPRAVGTVQGAGSPGPYAPVSEDGARGSLALLLALVGQSRDVVLSRGGMRGFRARTGLGREHFARAVGAHRTLVSLFGAERVSGLVDVVGEWQQPEPLSHCAQRV